MLIERLFKHLSMSCCRTNYPSYLFHSFPPEKMLWIFCQTISGEQDCHLARQDVSEIFATSRCSARAGSADVFFRGSWRVLHTCCIPSTSTGHIAIARERGFHIKPFGPRLISRGFIWNLLLSAHLFKVLVCHMVFYASIVCSRLNVYLWSQVEEGTL